MARERLQLVLRQQRGNQPGGPIVDLAMLQACADPPALFSKPPPAMPACPVQRRQEEICSVVMRHVDQTDPSDVSVSMRREGVLDVFEMQVTLPMSEVSP